MSGAEGTESEAENKTMKVTENVLKSGVRSHGATRTNARPRRRPDGRFQAADEAERFWAKVDTSAGPDGDWLWTGCLTWDGYGRFRVVREGRSTHIRAHVWAYEDQVGPTDGLPVDHVRDRGCRSRRCVNPAHLEAVSTLENTRRALAHQAETKGTP